MILWSLKTGVKRRLPVLRLSTSKRSQTTPHSSTLLPRTPSLLSLIISVHPSKLVATSPKLNTHQMAGINSTQEMSHMLPLQLLHAPISSSTPKFLHCQSLACPLLQLFLRSCISRQSMDGSFLSAAFQRMFVPTPSLYSLILSSSPRLPSHGLVQISSFSPLHSSLSPPLF